MKRLRISIGLICIATAIWMFVADEPFENPALPIVVLIIGVITMTANKRKNKPRLI